MAHWICEFCGRGFERAGSGKKRPIRFCSLRCFHAWRKANGVTAGQFKEGQIPWNKGMKGLHLSPETEFKAGHTLGARYPIGTVRIRTRKQSGKRRAWVKVAEPNTWRLRCHVLWEEAYGPIPKGLLIHHLNEDTLDDNLANLAAISRAAHLIFHRPAFEEKRLQNLRAMKPRFDHSCIAFES